MVLSNGNMTAEISAANVMKYQNVFGSEGYARGIHLWEVTVEETSNKSHIMIGVALEAQTIYNWVGKSENGWSWFGLQGSKHHNGKSPKYNNTFGKGDVIGVKLDLRKHKNQGVLSYYLNGTPLGKAFVGIITKPTANPAQVFYPAAVLRNTGDKISFKCTDLKYKDIYKKHFNNHEQ